MLEKTYDIRRSEDNGLSHVHWNRQKGLHCGAADTWLASNDKKPTCPKCAEALARALSRPWWGHLLEWLVVKPLLWLFTAVVILVGADLALTQGTITWQVLTGWLYP